MDNTNARATLAVIDSGFNEACAEVARVYAAALPYSSDISCHMFHVTDADCLGRAFADKYIPHFFPAKEPGNYAATTRKIVFLSRDSRRAYDLIAAMGLNLRPLDKTQGHR